MTRRRLLRFLGAWLVATSAFGGGCAGLPGGDATDGLQMKEPDAKFLKQVERDPFPRADAVPAARR